MNSVILIGRLIRDPELRYTQTSSSSYARFTIAVDKGMSKEKKQELEAKGQQTADFINIVVWGKQAEHCQKYLQKGRNVAIQGRLQSGSYTAQDGTRRNSLQKFGLKEFNSSTGAIEFKNLLQHKDLVHLIQVWTMVLIYHSKMPQMKKFHFNF